MRKNLVVEQKTTTFAPAFWENEFGCKNTKP